MGLNLEQKQAVVAEVAAKLAERAGRRRRRVPRPGRRARDAAAREGAASGVYLRVLKNTLARRAVAGTPFGSWPTRWSVR